MYTVTLMTNPAMYLEVALVDSLRNALGGGDILWLGPDRAAEFEIAKVPGNEAQIWASLQAEGVDLVIQPSGGRRKKLLLADMDSTMICQECIDELAAEAGVGEEVAAITARAMNGELEFEGALRERVALLRGLEAGVIGRVLARRITHMPGARTLVATMRAHGAHTSLVSGGFTAFTEQVAADLGFHDHRANTLLMANGELSGTVAEPILGRDAKVQALKDLTAALGITPAEVIAVGDGANDLGMLQLAGTGVALHAKPAVQKEARHRLNHSDLTGLLYMQGYGADEIVTR